MDQEKLEEMGKSVGVSASDIKEVRKEKTKERLITPFAKVLGFAIASFAGLVSGSVLGQLSANAGYPYSSSRVAGSIMIGMFIFAIIILPISVIWALVTYLRKSKRITPSGLIAPTAGGFAGTFFFGYMFLGFMMAIAYNVYSRK